MDDVVVLPHMTVTLAVEGDDQKAAIEAARQGNRQILLVPRVDGKFGAIGTVGRLGDSAELPTGAEAFMIRGEYRARLGSGQADIAGALWVKADPITDPETPSEKVQATLPTLPATRLT
jgi:ATP-dependent Lon protease